MRPAGASADGVQSREFCLGGLPPEHTSDDALHIRHGLCREVDLEADAPVHLLAEPERHADRLVRHQCQATAGTVAISTIRFQLRR